MNLARQMGVSGFGRLTATVINLASLILISRLLGPTEFGVFALLQAASVMGYSVLFYWLVSSVTRMAATQGNAYTAFGRAVSVGMGGAILICALLGLVGAAIMQGLGIAGASLMAIATVSAAIAEAFHMRVSETYRTFGRATGYSAALVLRAGFALAGAYLAIELFAVGGGAALAGHAAGCMMAAAIMAIGLHRPTFSAHGWKEKLVEIWNFGSPLSAALIFRIAVQRVDRFIIGAFFGKEAVGIYALAFDFANRALSIPLMISNVVLYPAMARAWEREDRPEVDRLAELNWTGLMLIGLPCTVGLIMIAEGAITLLFGASFAVEPAGIIAGFAAVTMLLEAMKLYHLDIAFMLRHSTKDQIRITGIGFVVNVGLCIGLIPVFGPISAAIVATTSAGLMAALSWRLGREHIKMPVRIPRGGHIVLACTGMASVILLLQPLETFVDLALVLGASGIAYVSIAMAINAGGCRQYLSQLGS